MVRSGLTTQSKTMLDVSGAYPNGESILNASRETTVAEVVKIKDVREDIYRRTAVNLTGGTTNAVEICCSVMGAPTFQQLLAHYESLEGSCEAVQDVEPITLGESIDEEVEDTEEGSEAS